MTSKIPVVKESDSISEVSSYISKQIKNFDSIDYIYVTDEKKRLVGVASIKDLYRFSADIKIKTACSRQLIKITPDSTQEEAAYLALQDGIKAIPVVDKEEKFLGVIPHDEIKKILHYELREDILHLGGINKSHAQYDNIMEIPLLKAVSHRILWLILGLFGGLFAAKIIGYFENTLEKNLILAAFIPLIVYIADAVGTQIEAFTIRDFVFFRKINFIKYFFKQFMIVFVLALVLGIIVALSVFGLYGDLKIAFVLMIAIFCASISALFSGLIIPFLFRKIGLDPANASGPIGTIIQDLTSVVIYFVIASILL